MLLLLLLPLHVLLLQLLLLLELLQLLPRKLLWRLLLLRRVGAVRAPCHGRPHGPLGRPSSSRRHHQHSHQ